MADFALTMVGLELEEEKSRWPIKLGIFDGGAPNNDGGEFEADVMMSKALWLMAPPFPMSVIPATLELILLFAALLLLLPLAFLFLVDGVCGTIPSSTAFTTIPPEDPPHDANEPIGVRLARSFLSMITG